MTAYEEERKKEGLKTASGFRYSPYQESDTVRQAASMLARQNAEKPTAYQSRWENQRQAAMDSLLNREPFSYDLNGDALYRQYRDQYVNQGKMAMMDTMGRAAALTGGYGSSYAQSAGQQAYQGYLRQLNDRIPELYQLALSRYQMEGDDLNSRYALLDAQEKQDYSRYRDTVSDWSADMDRLEDRYDTERSFDYGQWSDDRDFGYGQYVDDRDYQYQQERDQIADEQWQAEFDEAKRQFDILHSRKLSGGGSRKKSSGSEGAGLTVEEIYLQAKQGGAPARELDAMLNQAISEGAISQKAASELRNKRY